MERDNVFSLQDYLAVLRRQRGLIALIAVFAAVGGAVWFLLQTPMYEARAELALERVRAAQDVSLNELLNPSGNVRDTDVAGATSPSVAQSAAELLGRDDPSQLRTQVRAESVSEDRILRITATDADPVTAAQIADAFATSFIEYRRQEAVDTVLLTQGELDQRASEIREEISAVDAQIAALDIPAPAIEGEATEGEVAEGEVAEGEVAEDEADQAQGDEEGQATEDGQEGADAEASTDEQAAEDDRPAPTREELDQLETLQIRRNALRTQLSQVIARSTELGESADALTGFAADFTPASVPTTPVGNSLVEVVGVAFILGLALGIGLAFVRDHFDDVIRDEDDFKRASEGRPVLGRIPIWKPRDHDGERVVSVVDPTSSAAEAYRELSAGVRFLLVARADEPEHDAAEHHGLTRSRVVMICSANIGEGKTETAANLAVAAARVGLRTVLVDADLRRPSIAKRFGLGRTTGLSDALLNGEPAESHMVDVGVDDLYVLPAGTIPPNPAELLASPAMRAMQHGLLRKYDLIVIDTPAVLAVPDALEIGPYVDLAVMVGRVGLTGRRRLGAAVERLEQVGSAVSGTVLNGLDRATDGYYYAYAYQETPEKKGRRQTRRERKAAEARAKADAKAEAKQAKVDAKNEAKQAKVDAKAAKRARKRQGRGGGRRGADEQVEETLRAADGVTVIAAAATAGAAQTSEARATSEADTTAEKASLPASERPAAPASTDDDTPAGSTERAASATTAESAAPAATTSSPAPAATTNSPAPAATADSAADATADEAAADYAAADDAAADDAAADDAAADEAAADEIAAAPTAADPAATINRDGTSPAREAGRPAGDRVPGETDGSDDQAAPDGAGEPGGATASDADATVPDPAGAEEVEPGPRTDEQPAPRASTEPTPDDERTATTPEPQPAATEPPAKDTATTEVPEPEPEPQPAATEPPAKDTATTTTSEPTSSAPARRRSRRKTRSTAAKPTPTRRSSSTRATAATPVDGADGEVDGSERPVAQVASRSVEDDDDLLFGDRREDDAPA